MANYTIQSGDCLSAIAQRYGTTVEQLMAWNNLTNDSIKAGDQLIVSLDGTAGKEWEGDVVEKSGGSEQVSFPSVHEVAAASKVSTPQRVAPTQTKEQKFLSVINSKLNIPIYTTSIVERDGQKFLRISRDSRPENGYDNSKRDERCIGHIKSQLRIPDGIIQNYNDMGEVTGAHGAWKDSNTIEPNHHLDIPISAIGSSKYIFFGDTNEELRKAVEEYTRSDSVTANIQAPKTVTQAPKSAAPAIGKSSDIADTAKIQQPTQTEAKPASQQTQTQNPKYYTVQKNDTLSQIAKKFGVSQALLQKVNLLDNPNEIKIGQKLYIPENLSTEQIKDKIKTQAKELGIDESLALAIADHESGGFKPYSTSSSKAVGLFQLTDAAIDQLKENGLTNCKKTYDIDKNIEYGLKYFKWCLNQCGGNVKEALVSYNKGVGTVRKAKAEGKDVDSFEYKGNPPWYAKTILEIQKKYQ